MWISPGTLKKAQSSNLAKTASKAKKDEKRRRDEKAKSELEVKIDALNELVDSLRFDAGSLKDKIRGLEDYSAAQRKYIIKCSIQIYLL